MRALLERELAGRHLSFAHWTALVLTSSAPLSAAELARRQVAGHIVAGEAEGERSARDLIGLNLLCEGPERSLQHTAEGRRLFSSLSKAVEQITDALFGDLPRADLEITHRTLLDVATRATKMLSAK